MSLVKAIDDAVKFLEDHPEHFSRDVADKFCLLGKEICVLSTQARIDHRLPNVYKLDREVFDTTLGPVVYLSELNLPGDWWPKNAFDHHKKFIHSKTPHWLEAMAVLRALAESQEAEPPKVTPSNLSLDARALAVFIEHSDWTKKEMAGLLECNEKSLTPKRCPKLAAAIAAKNAADRPPRRGSKDSTGTLEAWEDGDEKFFDKRS